MIQHKFRNPVTSNVRPIQFSDQDERFIRDMIRDSYEGIATDLNAECECDPEDAIEPTMWNLQTHAYEYAATELWFTLWKYVTHQALDIDPWLYEVFAQECKS